MSATDSKSSRKKHFVADSLAVGMLAMLAMTIVQRGIGFLRGIYFCRALDDTVVGQWSMAYDFIIMVTPIMLLGMPGSLPRYVEHYRTRGHLSAFVKRMLGGTIVLAAAFFVAMMCFPSWFGWMVFLNASSQPLVHAVAASVLATIAFNFVYQMVTALRQVRVASLMQFFQSVGFTSLAIGWLLTQGNVVGVIYAYAIGTILAILPGAITLRQGWAHLPKPDESFQPSAMWRRILPFALSLWVMNLLANVFALTDRYMILHCLPADDVTSQAAVGQYHSGRMIPALLMSLAVMISGILLPYLAADWEANRRQAVRDRLNRILLGVSAGFTTLAAVALLLAPWIFSQLLEGRYGDGLALMPMAFVVSIWVALATIGEDYLWVAEKGKWVALCVGLGLAANIALNLILMPRMGLHGAVLATLLANGLVLLVTWFVMKRFGFTLGQSTFYISVIPLTLLAGPWIALICVGCMLLTHDASREAIPWRRLVPSASA